MKRIVCNDMNAKDIKTQLTGLVEAWNAQRFHLLISSFLCQIPHSSQRGLSWLTGEGGAALGVSDLFRIICIIAYP